MKLLLAITAILEAVTGVIIAVSPSSFAVLLLGSPLDAPASLVLGRVLGASLFSLGAACWLARSSDRDESKLPMIAAMLIYNLSVVGLLTYARLVPGLSGISLWPTVALHSAMGGWCVVGLWSNWRGGDGESV